MGPAVRYLVLVKATVQRDQQHLVVVAGQRQRSEGQEGKQTSAAARQYRVPALVPFHVPSLFHAPALARDLSHRDQEETRGRAPSHAHVRAPARVLAHGHGLCLLTGVVAQLVDLYLQSAPALVPSPFLVPFLAPALAPSPGLVDRAARDEAHPAVQGERHPQIARPDQGEDHRVHQRHRDQQEMQTALASHLRERLHCLVALVVEEQC